MREAASKKQQAKTGRPETEAKASSVDDAETARLACALDAGQHGLSDTRLELWSVDKELRKGLGLEPGARGKRSRQNINYLVAGWDWIRTRLMESKAAFALGGLSRPLDRLSRRFGNRAAN